MGDRRRSCLASDFVVLVLSETVLVLDGCLICGDTDRRSRRFVAQVASADAEQLKARRYHEKSQNTPNKPRPDANRQLLSARSSFPSTNQ
jgi:hypothetical protein